jgi:hypothetical protein
MAYEWHYDLSTDRPEAIEAFGDLYTAYALTGEHITQNSLCQVIRVELDGVGYFVKRYRRGSENSLALFATSKARREWNNLLRFAQWDLPVARLVAWGEESLFGVSGTGLVITEEVVGATDLSVLANNDSALFDDGHWVEAITQQIATAAATMHRHKFAHNDFHWRNILISGPNQSPQVTLIDCPSGRFWCWPFLQHRRIKDLACLDKIAKQKLSRASRLRFYRHYIGLNNMTATDKTALQKVIHFFAGRE